MDIVGSQVNNKQGAVLTPRRHESPFNIGVGGVAAHAVDEARKLESRGPTKAGGCIRRRTPGKS